jgi:large subunit ribosomal protein L13
LDNVHKGGTFASAKITAESRPLFILKTNTVNTLSYKTKSAKKEEVDRRWFIVDADGEVVGRLATRIATVLRGKHKPSYTPHVDTGDYVIVINSEKLRLTGQKIDQKEYIRYTGYPGGQRKATPRDLMNNDRSELIIENAVKGMLPKNRLGRSMIKKLFVYAGSEHPHQAQKPETLDV